MNTESTDPLAQAFGWIKRHMALVIVAVLVIAVGGAALIFFSWRNSINNEAYGQQRDVFKVYNQYQTALSTCLDQSRIAAQISTEEYDRFKDTVTPIIGARYDGEALTGDAAVSVLVESYPEVDRSLWKQFMSTALGCRANTGDVNDDLQRVAGDFDTWVHQGGVFEKMVRNNWPNDELKVTGLNGVLTGQDALDFIVTPLTTGEALNALKTHTMPDQDLFPSDESSE